ncbi:MULTISPECIES: hypothetical protein [unclassified Corynebacterium]|uniref:hypothetical protein n=1 Tax=unclassified Corynebacterium TaxID=2624378 RepID=UPI0029CA52AF|nr:MULTISPECIES: hypothetical protein [unclassified Corynebacterium]WPF65706.1 hypothetical protein OLX12_09060 [Corynebacterium sp. 22KM0430]WPF68202.1 hypothetical protein OLW90_09055 [Corynebacterium sp. 21KM1197]
MTAIVLGSWFMLRTTIDAKDTAPAAVLDEYENQVLNTSRSLAYGLTCWILPIVAGFLIVLGVHNPANLERWAYSLGLFTIIVHLAIVAFPTVGYSLAFHTSDAKD